MVVHFSTAANALKLVHFSAAVYSTVNHLYFPISSDSIFRSEQAKLSMVKAKAEATELQQKAQRLIREAKNYYRDALLPYKEACKRAGVECEYSTGRISNVSDRVVFLTERVDDGVKVAIKGRPETEEIITTEALNQSLNRAAYGFCNKHIGPREEVGNKGGTLSNRLRKLWK